MWGNPNHLTGGVTIYSTKEVSQMEHASYSKRINEVETTSLIREVARQAVESVLPQKKKSPTAGTADDSQITMTF